MDKAKELVILILKEDPNWTVEAINEAMKGEKRPSISSNETRYIFVILLFVDDIGKINFYNDLYQRDDRLADLLFSRIQSKTNQTS
jgi:murein L,D-transpeptidase YcbB/YkuD